jgi:hypothetical protein
MTSSMTSSGPLVPSLEGLRASSLNISQAHLIAPNPTTPGSLVMPWESPRDLAPASEFATPGHFLAKTLCLEFVQHSRDLLEEFLLKVYNLLSISSCIRS